MAKIKRTIEIEGGEYLDKITGGTITAVCWAKDGDHPLVERYPIERRDFKGLLVVGPKEKYALHYGDWICEDAEARIYIASAEAFAGRYEPAEPAEPKRGSVSAEAK